MISQRHRRIWTAIAIFALVLSLVLVLLPHAGAVAACFVLLKFFFLGFIPIPVLLARWDLLRVAHTPDAPALPVSFQRPPPFRFAGLLRRAFFA